MPYFGDIDFNPHRHKGGDQAEGPGECYIGISILTATRAVTEIPGLFFLGIPISILTATRAVTAKLPKFLFLKSTSFAQFVHSRIAHTQNFTIYPSNLFFTSHFRSYLQCESNRYVMLTYSSHNCISVSLLLSSKQWYIVLHMLKLFLDTIKTFYYISFFHINDNEKHSRYTQISKVISATSICYFEYYDIIFYRDKNSSIINPYKAQSNHSETQGSLIINHL